MTSSARVSAKVLLIDMEQYGNWEFFTAPEIYNVERLKGLSRSDLVPKEARERFHAIVLEHLPHRTAEQSVYSNPKKGYFDV